MSDDERDDDRLQDGGSAYEKWAAVFVGVAICLYAAVRLSRHRGVSVVLVVLFFAEDGSGDFFESVCAAEYEAGGGGNGTGRAGVVQLFQCVDEGAFSDVF